MRRQAERSPDAEARRNFRERELFGEKVLHFTQTLTLVVSQCFAFPSVATNEFMCLGLSFDGWNMLSGIQLASLVTCMQVWGAGL